jgi:transposase
MNGTAQFRLGEPVRVTEYDTGPLPHHREERVMLTESCIAGIDVHKKMLAVVVRAERDGQLAYEKRKFGTTRGEIQHLGAYLQHYQVKEVVMESTADYWRPVWYVLEGHFSLHLVHPLKVRAPRGRKRDYRDAMRLADRWRSGDLEDSFIPGAEQRQWRWLTRSRVQLNRMIGIVRNQMEGLLEEGGIKLTAVVTDPFGVSGWAILQQLAKGETDVKVMAAEARGAMRKKRARLEEALAGKLNEGYRFLLKQRLQQVEMLRSQIEEINDELARAMKAHVVLLRRLGMMPGINLYAAQELLAEIGVGAVAFPTADQFASWVGVCPGSQESAGVCYSRRSAKGNRYLRRLLCQIAWAAIHAKDSFFAGLFARLKPRIEGKGAAWAVAHRIAKVICLVMHEGVEYQEKGSAPLHPKTLNRKLRRLLKDFAKAGIDAQAALTQALTAEATPQHA